MVKPFSVHFRLGGWLSSVIMALLFMAACQSGEEGMAPIPTNTKIAATPIQVLIQTQAPVATKTAAAHVPTVTDRQTEDTESSAELSPTPTTPPEPTATATPPPIPTFYMVQPGDTLVGIADQFDLTLDALVLANGFTSTDEFPLIVGVELQIPGCDAHQILPGNTIAGVAQLCGVTLDELVTNNIDRLASLGSLDAVPIGFILYIPEETNPIEGVDCSTQPPREQVIEYQPRPGEGLFCLSQKYGVSTDSLIQGNIERLTGGDVYGSLPLLIPPADGALYVVTADDVEQGLSISDLAEWYEVELDGVTDWNGNPANAPLTIGQQLYIFGADLAGGLFQSQPVEEEGSE